MRLLNFLLKQVPGVNQFFRRLSNRFRYATLRVLYCGLDRVNVYLLRISDKIGDPLIRLLVVPLFDLPLCRIACSRRRLLGAVDNLARRGGQVVQVDPFTIALMAFIVIFGSRQKHLCQYAEGQRDEDHLGQALFNVAALIETEYRIACDRLPAELADLPHDGAE